MAAYTYTALDSKGVQLEGVLEADSLRLARQQLRDQGYIPVEVSIFAETAKNKLASTRLFSFGGLRLTVKQLSLVTRQLATLLAAGIPLEEVLLGVGEQAEKPKIKSILLSVRSKVLEGNSLASGMADFPHAFPALYRATIAAGEQTGRLDTVLIRLADYTERQQEMRQKIQQALIYPTLMTSVSVIIVIFLMIFVVPKMVAVFSTNSQILPLATRVLLVISHSMKYVGPAFLVFGSAFLIGFAHILRKNKDVRRRFHRGLLKIPLLGKTIKAINTARFSRTFGILLAAGVPVLEAMKISADLVNNLPIHEALSVAILRVREGVAINQALKLSLYFPSMSLHLIASGEATGQLEAMLERAANNQEKEVERLIDTLLTLFEPLLILGMGSVVLFIVMAVLLPVFSLNQFAG
ncbi:MAG: type II secretion system inner membrane protein GspF [Gammaproteobacteria bacterium]|nr:type II secretion system inner membrane protein GspF [Gammaproteobacteria bacterium]